MSEALPRRSSVGGSSPEFEFWMVGHPSSDQFLTADELFADGVLRPLHHLPHSEPSSLPASAHSSPPPPPPPAFPSKRWKDIFKAFDFEMKDSVKKGRKNSTSSAAAELNIKIWPFSRSRSAGTSSKTRAAVAPPPHKASSAPCSRSNSCGESSKPKKSAAGSVWAGLHAGIHLGRSRPVWQLRRRSKQPENKEKKSCGGSSGGGGVAVRVLNLNVNRCIGYRNQVSCGVSSGEEDGPAGDVVAGGSGRLLSLRTILFSKKVY